MLVKYPIIVLTIASLVLVSSCANRSKVAQKRHSGYVSEDEARLSDVPFYIGARNFSVETFGATTEINYQLKNSRAHIERFYELEMEREGWIAQTKWQSTETALHFAKGPVDCLIVIADRNSLVHVRIKLTKSLKKEIDE